MKFGHIEIFATDTIKSKDFYVNILGFEIEEIQNEKFVWMKYSDQLFLLRPGKKEIQTVEYKNSDIGFVFYADELEKTRDELISRGLEFKGTDGSPSCLTFTDPDGNWFQLVDPKLA